MLKAILASATFKNSQEVLSKFRTEIADLNKDKQIPAFNQQVQPSRQQSVSYRTNFGYQSYGYPRRNFNKSLTTNVRGGYSKFNSQPQDRVIQEGECYQSENNLYSDNQDVARWPQNGNLTMHTFAHAILTRLHPVYIM